MLQDFCRFDYRCPIFNTKFGLKYKSVFCFPNNPLPIFNTKFGLKYKIDTIAKNKKEKL